MRTLRVLTLALGTAASVAAAGCSRNQLNGDLSPQNAVTVDIQNQNFHEMEVYVISEGLATRLGTVPGNQTQDFILDPSMITPDLRIVATPFGGNGRASTGPLNVSVGETITFRIDPILRTSSAFIRRR